MTHRSETDLHVLVLPSFYPNRDEPTRGTFFKDQALAVRRSGARVGVLYPHRSAMSARAGSDGSASVSKRPMKTAS